MIWLAARRYVPIARLDLEADQVLIRIGLELRACHLQHIERELHHHVPGRRITKQDVIAILRPKLRVNHRHGVIDGGMCGVVAHVVGECAERERVLVNGLCISNQCRDEVAGAHVVNQVRKEVTAERVVAEILDQRSAVCVCACLLELLR